MSKFAIVDLFAGPGGLAEGFSSLRKPNGDCPFSVVLSVEKESSAHATLKLRSFLRQFDKFPKEYYQFLNGKIAEPDWKKLYPKQWQAACDEALHLELGSKNATKLVDARLSSIKAKHGKNIILIGGPPCQAYSLVGRARNKGVVGYNASDDHRHFLYREYIRILEHLLPAAFVMENVKGMLSSKVDGESVFDRVLEDLRSVGKGPSAYELITLAPRRTDDSNDYIVCSEDYGLPQARHRVIVIGIRKDAAARLDMQDIRKGILGEFIQSATVRQVLEGMPALRSGLSKSEDSAKQWKKIVLEAMQKVMSLKQDLPEKEAKIFAKKLKSYKRLLSKKAVMYDRSSTQPFSVGEKCPKKLRQWLLDPALKLLPNHETRGHMPSDLSRYFFAAVYGEIFKVSPKASHYPSGLAPRHKNWTSGKFADRFRVQLWDQPSTTITSHISKDGHYFIHPDPLQCRSLTVREAARLQTFPDNYYFKGNRTQQYVQVGNAVPPYLARQIAESIYYLLKQDVGTKKTTNLNIKHAKNKFSEMHFQMAGNMN